MFLANAVSPQNVKAVPADQFVDKIVTAVSILTEAAGGLVLPLIGLGLTVSILLLVLGGIFRSEHLRKTGVGGLASCFIGGFLYFAIPTMLGFFKTLANIF